MHIDHQEYIYFCKKYMYEKSMDTIYGIFRGISIDKELTNGEVRYLKDWINDHKDLSHRHPFNELFPAVEVAIADNIVTKEEQEDILWLCERMNDTGGYFDDVTQSIRHLHGILEGIIADAQIKETELKELRKWINKHDFLKTCWPYDEVDALLTSVMADGVIDQIEHKQLMSFFLNFAAIEDDKTIGFPTAMIGGTLTGVCACCPEIIFEGKQFCFTGAMARNTRKASSDYVVSLGGKAINSLSARTDYLIIGSAGNPCWAYACYGRKVESAINMRKSGSSIMLIHENDFVDALLDAGVGI